MAIFVATLALVELESGSRGRLFWDRDFNHCVVLAPQAEDISTHLDPKSDTYTSLPPTMAESHTLTIYNHVNLASRSTVTEADAFMKPFNLSMNAEKSVIEDGKSAQIRYFHRATRRWYRANATLAEINEDPTRNWLQALTDLFPWAILEQEGEEDRELSGRLLGTSGRVDGLQGCDVRKAAGVDGGHSSTDDDRALVVWHPNDFLGDLGSLPKELRFEVYKHAVPRTFWQCYHTKLPGITLLGMTRSSRPPTILNISKVIREEVLDSAYCDRRLEVIIGMEVIAFNFPLLPTLQAGQTLDNTQARLPKSGELFIGIQVPSPRSSIDEVVRDNVKRVVVLLNSIALNQSLPPIRVSFKTNQETSSGQYYASDFKALLGPLAELRLGKRDPDGKVKKPLVIDRVPPYSSKDGRDAFCEGIEAFACRLPAKVLH